MAQPNRRVVVCYIPGLDTRRISADLTPAIAALIDRYPSLKTSSLPTTDVVPVLLSGVYPHQNRIWQVSIDEQHERTITQRLVDMLPDLVTTTAQCVRHKFNPKFDLAGIPPRRLREFTQHRLSETNRAASPAIMAEFNGYKSLLSLLGEDSKYTFSLKFDTLDALAQRIPDESVGFEFLQMHAMDIYQHWHIDNDAGMREALGRTDEFVARLRDNCADSGHTLVLLCDHGQEPVTNKIPFVQTLKESGVPQADYSYYVELSAARLWFHTDRARDTIIPLIRNLPDCQLLHFSEMHQYHVCFDDSQFGEYTVMAEPGSIFFPHDFYQPIANFYLGLFGPSQETRTFNPVHKGSHGYLPHHPSEQGFVVVVDDGVQPNRETMSVIDFAPTMLAYLGAEIPSHMTGQSVLTECQP